MKLNLKKLYNPSNIDFKKVRLMSPDPQSEYLKEVYKSELSKLWVQLTYTINYLCTTNTWQYIVALWMMK
jgi:hypothetical protein